MLTLSTRLGCGQLVASASFLTERQLFIFFVRRHFRNVYLLFQVC